eukprot:m51a1_g4391 hypothetical protein (323) ;mRNA; f:359384-360629
MRPRKKSKNSIPPETRSSEKAALIAELRKERATEAQLTAKLAALTEEKRLLEAAAGLDWRVFEDGPCATVACPPHLERVFKEAEAGTARRFRAESQSPEEKDTVRVAAAFAAEMHGLTRRLLGEHMHEAASALARDMLYEMGFSEGLSSAPAALPKSLSAASAHMSAIAQGLCSLAFAGWASVEMSPDTVVNAADPPDSFVVLHSHNSFESETLAGTTGDSRMPVCAATSGYVAGWCSAVLGAEMAGAEVQCRSRGDEYCTFVVASRDRIVRVMRAYAELHSDSNKQRLHCEDRPLGMRPIPASNPAPPQKTDKDKQCAQAT